MESHRSLDPREGKRDTAATAREERARACPHMRRGMTPLGRLQKYPKIHVSTGEESSGSGTEYTQGFRPRHRRERNPESPTHIQRSPISAPKSRGGILSLRGRERIPGVPVASQVEAHSTGKARGTPGLCHIPRVPQMSQSIPGKPVFPALPRLSSRGSTHTTVARGTALWESLVG